MEHASIFKQGKISKLMAPQYVVIMTYTTTNKTQTKQLNRKTKSILGKHVAVRNIIFLLLGTRVNTTVTLITDFWRLGLKKKKSTNKIRGEDRTPLTSCPKAVLKE